MKSFWEGKSVLLTGHTGFKGGWLALWLNSLGAKVHGFALPAEKQSFYEVCGIKSLLASEMLADLADKNSLTRFVEAAKPEIVFHLAAQSLVRLSYQSPVETFATNVMGTVHLIEAARHAPSVGAVINVTSDKCYENLETGHAYQESDAMGGHDPYSASKGCAELVTSSFRRSFMTKTGPGLASGRAGNVIGGGDWSEDRLIPDFLKAWDEERTLIIRSPLAVRPWQHVLDPLSGYMLLAERLYASKDTFAEGWNFGPDASDSKTVDWITNELLKLAPGSRWEVDPAAHPHEAKLLSLDSTKARTQLGWQPRWHVSEALQKTCDWHIAWKQKKDMRSFSLQQIKDYSG